MKDTIQKLNDVLGHLTAMSFMRPETSEDLEKPLNDLSEAISEFENLDIPIVSKSLLSEEFNNGYIKGCEDTEENYKANT